MGGIHPKAKAQGSLPPKISRDFAKEELIEYIANFRKTLLSLGFDDCDVEYEICDATLDASDGAIQINK